MTFPSSRTPRSWRTSWLVGVLVCGIVPTLSARADQGSAGEPAAPTTVATTGAAPSAIIARDPAGAVTLRAVRLAQPLRIDGRLDEALYRAVAPISDFVQIEPEDGRPATERTELWVAFDANNVYVTFRCFESEPARVVAKEMRRDHTSIYLADDNVTFFFDTFRDLRNGLEFSVNAVGGRIDGQTTGERQWSGDWNTIWDVQVGRFDGGWTVEVAIPFKSLRYRPGVDQTWGFNAFRTNRWKNELSFLVPVPKERGQAGVHMASLAAPLTGIVAPSGAKNLEVKPFATASATGRRAPGRGIANDLAGDAGVDVKYGVTQSVTADVTVNTDFAQVEADLQQVNLTRFSLFFPEKREFFLENAGTFQFGGATTGAFGGGGDAPILFYSRRIGLERGRAVPIDVGGRATGRIGRYTFGLLSVQTGAEVASGAASTNFSVVRFKRDVLSRSSVGLLATGRNAARGGVGDNIVYGADGTFAFLTNLAINTYWARSETPGRSGDDTSYRAQLLWPGDRYGIHVERVAVGANFDPGIGFVRRRDMRRTFGQARFTPRPRNNAVVRRYQSGVAVTLVENGAGRLESREQSADVGIEFQNGDRFSLEAARFYEFLSAPFRFPSGVTLPIGGYDFGSVRVGLNRSGRQRVSGNLFAELGSFYNGRKTEVGVGSGRLNLSPRISLEPSYAVNRVELDQGTFTTQLASARVTWTVTPLMFTSALVQYNADTRTVSANARLRWEYRPGSELFVVYNEERDTLARRFPGLANRALIVKVNRLMRF
jgi:hypothetical protein